MIFESLSHTMKATKLKKPPGLPPPPKRKNGDKNAENKKLDPRTKPADPRVKNSVYFGE